jgi:hypothetical protein
MCGSAIQKALEALLNRLGDGDSQAGTEKVTVVPIQAATSQIATSRVATSQIAASQIASRQNEAAPRHR